MHVYVFMFLLADIMKHSAWDIGVNSNSTGWPFHWGVIHLWPQVKAWLMDTDLVPCSLSLPFTIYQPRNVSWFTPHPRPSPTSCMQSTASQHHSITVLPGPLSAIVIFLGLVEAKLSTEQHEPVRQQKVAAKETIRQASRSQLVTLAIEQISRQNLTKKTWFTHGRMIHLKTAWFVIQINKLMLLQILQDLNIPKKMSDIDKNNPSHMFSFAGFSHKCWDFFVLNNSRCWLESI